MRKGPRDLIGAGDSGARDAVRRFAEELAALEPDAAAVRRVMAAHQVDERRFPGAVRADQAEDLAVPHLELDPRQRLNALERFRDLAHHPDWFNGFCKSRNRHGLRSATRQRLAMSEAAEQALRQEQD